MVTAVCTYETVYVACTGITCYLLASPQYWRHSVVVTAVCTYEAVYVACTGIILQKVLESIVKRPGTLLLVVKANSLWSSISMLWYSH